MKALFENKIDIVNRIAESICRDMCSSDNCGLCQLAQLKTGIDLTLGEGVPVDEAVLAIKDSFRSMIADVNHKYDIRYRMEDLEGVY